MTSALGEGSLCDLGGFVDPLDSLFDPDCTLVYDGTVLFEQDPDLLSAEGAASWLADERRVTAGDSCQPANMSAIVQSPVSGTVPTMPALVPAAQSAGLVACVPSCEWSDLTGLPHLDSASSEASEHAGLGTANNPLPASTHSSHQQQQQQRQRQQLVKGSTTPRQQRGRGRPRTDRSQMTDRQLKAIRNAQNNHERKKNHLRDLEERIADIREELERERAHQEDSQRSVAVLERLLSYKDEMVAILSKHGTAAGSASPVLEPAVTPSNQPQAPSASSSVPSTRAQQAAGLPLLQGGITGRAGAVEQQAQPGYRVADAAACTAARDGCRCRLRSSCSSGICSSCGVRQSPGLLADTLLRVPLPLSQRAESWLQKLPATWRFVQDVLQVQLPALKAGGFSPAGPYLPASSQPLQQQQQQLQLLQLHECWQPMPGSCWSYLAGHGADSMAVITAAASPAVVAEVKSMSAADMIDGWRDVARHARDVLREYEVTQNEATAVAQLRPHTDRLAVLLNLAMVHNQALMKHLYLSSAGSLPEGQHRETYDALVAAMEVTPSQQERYLELAEAYASFVQRARQHKTEALMRIQKSAHSSFPTPAGLGQMSSQYLEVVEGASMLTAYPDAEFAAIHHLSKGMAKIYRPLQKARAAAMAYPHFLDLLTMMDAIKRLPPPEQRKQQQLGVA